MKAVKTASLLLGGTVGLLFVVYFWNLDQKLMGWAYVMERRSGHGVCFYWLFRDNNTSGSAGGVKYF